MARQHVERLVDDLDGSDAVETVSFGLDGVTYEIDLNKRNAAAMRKVFDRYVAAARVTGRGRRTTASKAKRNGRSTTGQRRKAAARKYEISDLREWAGANKVKVPARGRIPQAVVEQYLSSKS